jgi:DNA polymerase-3 subunit epsilon
MKHATPSISVHADVLDTLSLARKLHPGQRNSLDALCKRYQVDSSRRDVHGALIDSELLARVYLAMTGGQAALSLDSDDNDENGAVEIAAERQRRGDLHLVTVRANAEESAAHDEILERMKKSGKCLWIELASDIE